MHPDDEDEPELGPIDPKLDALAGRAATVGTVDEDELAAALGEAGQTIDVFRRLVVEHRRRATLIPAKPRTSQPVQ